MQRALPHLCSRACTAPVELWLRLLHGRWWSGSSSRSSSNISRPLGSWRCIRRPLRLCPGSVHKLSLAAEIAQMLAGLRTLD